MAQRRMFSNAIIDTDLFLDMPLSSQALYFHLGMKADDNGFIGNPKKIVRSVNCTEDDLKLLIAKGFIIAFESGIVVVTHWKRHNSIQKDRFHETIYKEELSKLIENGGIYRLSTTMDTNCIQNVSKMETEVSIGKVSKGKVSNNAPPDSSDEAAIICLPLNDKSLYSVSNSDVEHYRELYPAVNVEQELRNMCGWLESNPRKRKTKSGITRFINNRLSKEQNKGGTTTNTTENKPKQMLTPEEAKKVIEMERNKYG